jgi:hypothetical protein
VDLQPVAILVVGAVVVAEAEVAVEHHRAEVLRVAVNLRVAAPAVALPVEVRLRLAEDLQKVETRPEMC